MERLVAACGRAAEVVRLVDEDDAAVGVRRDKVYPRTPTRPFVVRLLNVVAALEVEARRERRGDGRHRDDRRAQPEALVHGLPHWLETSGTDDERIAAGRLAELQLTHELGPDVCLTQAHYVADKAAAVRVDHA